MSDFQARKVDADAAQAEAMTEAHTPTPWDVGEYSDTLGYDCMTGGMRVGPVVLDGRDYGQENCVSITPDVLARMMADAHLIRLAVNSHARLLKEREELRAALTAALPYIEKVAARRDRSTLTIQATRDAGRARSALKSKD